MSEWVVPLLVLLLGGGGVASSLVMLRKLPGEKTIAAVTAADKSIDSMLKINEKLEEDRDYAWLIAGYWQGRCANREAILYRAGIEVDPWPGVPAQGSAPEDPRPAPPAPPAV